MRSAIYPLLIVAAAFALGACKTDTYVPNAKPPATSEPGVDVVNRAPEPPPADHSHHVEHIEVEPGSTVIIVDR